MLGSESASPSQANGSQSGAGKKGQHRTPKFPDEAKPGPGGEAGRAY